MQCLCSLIYSELLTYLGKSVLTTTYSYANYQGMNMQLGWKHSITLGVQENANLYSLNECDNSITLCLGLMDGTHEV